MRKSRKGRPAGMRTEAAKGVGRSSEKATGPGRTYWLYGEHPVAAAMANPDRAVRDLVCVEGNDIRLPMAGGTAMRSLSRPSFAQLLPPSAVHQGVACLVTPLRQPPLADVMANAAAGSLVVVLDQVTDPHNVGAILRSAAAFGADAVIVPRHNAAPESAVMAKAASGALERIPMVAVANLGRALEQLAGAGYWCLGLDGEGHRTLAEARGDGRTALVLGAEGRGLRRLTRDYCDELVRLPTSDGASLNVSNAAAAALYEFRRMPPPQA